MQGECAIGEMESRLRLSELRLSGSCSPADGTTQPLINSSVPAALVPAPRSTVPHADTTDREGQVTVTLRCQRFVFRLWPLRRGVQPLDDDARLVVAGEPLGQTDRAGCPRFARKHNPKALLSLA